MINTAYINNHHKGGYSTQKLKDISQATTQSLGISKNYKIDATQMQTLVKNLSQNKHFDTIDFTKTLENAYKVFSNLMQFSKNELPLGFEMDKNSFEILKIYDKAQDLENNFAQDFTFYMGLESLEKKIYGQKDSSILALLGLLYNNENMSANWGIIQESKKSDYVLIGIDLPDLNMPLRLHIKKDLVEKFTQAHQGNKIMPIYAGKDDFIVNGRYIATHVLTPLSKDQKREIEEISTQIRETDYRHKLVKHLVFLTDMQKFPEHLQKKIIIYKKGKTKVKFEKMLEYIDIETNRKYIKTKEGQFILQDDER